MINCNTFIITNNNTSKIPSLNIGGGELTYVNGNFHVKDENGILKQIGSNVTGLTLSHTSITSENIVQTIIKNDKDYEILLDGDSHVGESIVYLNDDDNAIEFLTNGTYFIIYNVSIENINNAKQSSVSCFMKIKTDDIDYTIIDESVSYTTVAQKGFGQSTLVSSYIVHGQKDHKIKLYMKKINGAGFITTIPKSISISIFKIE